MKSGRIKIGILSVILIIFVFLFGCSTPHIEGAQIEAGIQNISIADDGIPFIIDSAGNMDVYSAALVGTYALQYGGYESFLDEVVGKNENYFHNCIDWLMESIQTNDNGHKVWLNNFDANSNDIEVEAPWYSSYTQAIGIEALLACYEETGQSDVLQLAEEAAKIFFVSIEKGGLLFQRENDIWFEEFTVPNDNPTHSLNGHLRTLITLKKLYLVTNESFYNDWYQKGINTLLAWLPKYDTGYWLKSDLNPQKEDLCFRFNNKYGYALTELAIDKIIITDPLTKDSFNIDVGEENDDLGVFANIMGSGWDVRTELDNRSIRRLNKDSFNETYFYLDLPGEWIDNLRSEWFELTIVYKDEKPGNINIEMQSIAQENDFIDLKDGDLLLTGSDEWREWNVPIRITDLGWRSKCSINIDYWDTLSTFFPQLLPWKDIFIGYINSISRPQNYELVTMEKQVLPQQSPLISIYSLDKDGVLRNHIVSENTRFDENGKWLVPSIGGEAVYNPYIIACQALEGERYLENTYLYDIRQFKDTDEYWCSFDWVYPDTLKRIKRQPAYRWLNENKKKINDGYVWLYNFNNCYNDLIQESGWQSAFSQRYIIDAYISIDDKKAALYAANAYKYTTKEGGLSSFNKGGDIWFEEVPNNSHILNAHLASNIALDSVINVYPDDEIEKLSQSGIQSLLNNIYRFDTGYWTKYDLNPKKEILMQFDWLEGVESPIISTIQVYNPISNTATNIDVGESDAFSNYPNITGSEWTRAIEIDGVSGRQFNNGYLINEEALPGGTKHNVYFNAVLPERKFEDYFDVPEHQVYIKYKDIAKGKFALKIQSINEGNFLTFTEIPDGIIECVGDNQWKTVTISLPTNAMGWYMGEDYQAYHIEQLEIVAEQTNHWLLKQYLEKWRYYLECYKTGKAVVIADTKDEIIMDISSKLVSINSSDTYEGYGIENSLDQNMNDNYTAFLETSNSAEQSFIVGFDESVLLKEIQFTFESDKNYATDYEILFFNNGEEISKINVNDQISYQQKITFDTIKADSFKVITKGFHGQQRVLLRQIKAFGYLCG